MVERRIELNRRYHRKKKMAKLKERLLKAKTTTDRDTIVAKIMRIRPWWNEEIAMAGKQGRMAASAQASGPKTKGSSQRPSGGPRRK
jgi:hypothetical protein